MQSPSSRAFSSVIAAALLLIPPSAGCGGEGDGAEARLADGETVAPGVEPSRSPARVPSGTSPRVQQENRPDRRPPIAEMGYDRGSPEAPVKVLEISDFGCGYCRQFHETVYPDIQRVYVDRGYVEWKFIPFVLGVFPNGLQAATAAECAGEQGRFFSLQSRLFSAQGNWKNHRDPSGLFSRWASEEGLDVERFENCLDGGWRDHQVKANIRLGQQAGARGTPHFLIDGRPLSGFLSFQDFRQLLDAALLQRGITPPKP